MSKDKIADYDGTTAGNNTDIGGISIAEGMLPSAVNNSMRELTKQLGAFANGTDPIDALTVTGAATVNGAFTSPGIDDNADATAITIDSSEKVGIGDTSPLGNKVHIRTAGSATSVNGDAGLVLESDDSTRCDLQFMGPDGAFQSVYFGDVSDDNRGIIAYSHSGNNMRFTVDASERMRLTSDGLTFNGDTAAANALGDYEEGDWEPTLLGASSNPTVTYSGDTGGHYVKIGTLLYLTGCLRYNARSGGSGAARVGGLPFTIDARSNGDNSDGCGPIRVNVWNGTNPKPTLFAARQNDDKLNIYSTDEDHTSTTLEVSDMGTACMMQFTIVVHTAS